MTELSPSSRYSAVREQLLAHPKTWLVTGAAGFIGSNLVEELLSLAQTVVALDNFSTGHQHNLDEATSLDQDADRRFRFVEGDIRDLAACQAAVPGVDFVLHQAALGSVPRSIADPITSSVVNVDGFLNVLVAARDASVTRVVYASSSSVYGDVTVIPQVEDRTGQVLSPYAATKATNELYAAVFQRTYGLQTVGLRYFNVFGKRQDPKGAYAAVIPRWVAELLDGTQCEIYGDGETSRDFCYIANVVQANILAAVSPSDAPGAVYNVSCGEETSLNELFRMIRDGLQEQGASIAVSEPRHLPARQGDIRRSRAEIGKARRVLGYEPTHPVAAGMRDALEWYAARLGNTAAPAAL